MEIFLPKRIILGVIALMLSLSSCNGILEGIYDDIPAEKQNDYGFIKVDKNQNSGLIYIDASSYTQWTYIDFHTLTIEAVEIDENTNSPQNWDFAIHRYDAKTNEGEVLETGFTGLSTLKRSGKLPLGEYVKDIWSENKIIIDMSQMMEGKLGYEPSYYNSELAKWLYVDMTNMPPSYYPSNKVYVIKLKDGSAAAVRLQNFMNASNIKGFMTIEYIYPLEF